MRYLTLSEIIQIYRQLMKQSGGAVGISNLHGLESAVAQPYMTFGGNELYPTIVEKAAALGFSLINNHPFVDGNKRIGHAVMEVFLVLICALPFHKELLRHSILQQSDSLNGKKRPQN